MYLYLIRHGKSKPKELDPESGLTEEGIEETRKTAQFLESLKPDIHIIWHSQKKRATQTAHIFADILKIPNRILEHSALAPMDTLKPVLEELQRANRNKIIVGHLPYLNKLALVLITKNENAGIIHFQNSEIVCLQRSDLNWKLEWIISPQILK